MDNGFIDIENVLVDRKIIDTNFTCDLDLCKGGCCTMESEYGAPLEESEIEIMEKYLEIILKNLSLKNKNAIIDEGFWEKKSDLLMIKSINDRDCVFSYFDGDIANCGIERAYLDGKINFRKPISCHLFPIRISEFGGKVLRFEKYYQCEPALLNGVDTNLSIASFCKDALERLFGEKWIKKLDKIMGS